MNKQAKETRAKEIFYIEVGKIVPNPSQPRKIFTDEGIIRLSNSIRQYGIMQPLTVREFGEEYELISGERRLRAAKEAELVEVPCIILQASDSESAEMAIIENLMRQDLNVFEQAEAIEALLDSHELTQEEIARKLSVSQSFVANKLRILRLSESEREKILRAGLTERHARALLKLKNGVERERALEAIVAQGMNVSKAEDYINKLSGAEETESTKRAYKSADQFCETIARAISLAENSGIKIKSRKIENEGYTELTIFIPRNVEKEHISQKEA